MSSLYRFNRIYTGPVKACILDWCGTTANRYSIGTVRVFDQVFRKHKVPINKADIHKSMGLRTDLQISEIMKIPSVAKNWKDVHGHSPSEEDVKKLFSDFLPTFTKCLQEYSELIPGTSKAVDSLKTDFHCKIGSTTWLPRAIVEILLGISVKQGYRPDTTVAGDEVNNGVHPKPHMIYKCMDLLDIQPIQSVVKVGATSESVTEALEAGCWAVAVSRYSNYMYISSVDEETEISEDEIKRRKDTSHDLLVRSGAHYVIESIAQLPDVVSDINKRLTFGEKP